MDHRSITIVDDLSRQCGEEYYHAARERFIRLCTDAGISEERIGFFGAVTCPSVSDLDALVISDARSIRRLQRCFEDEKCRSRMFCYIFPHPPVYVVEDAWHMVQSLHTLDGMKFVRWDSKFQAEIDGRPRQSHQLLHVVWFTSLVRAIAALHFRNHCSLRRLLLIQKNLEHSYRFFSTETTDQNAWGWSSEELRLYVLDKSKSDKDWVLDIVLNQFDLVLQAFDSYCSRLEWEGLFEHSMGHWQFVHRTMLVKRAEVSCLKMYRHIALLHTNPLSFSLAYFFATPTGVPQLFRTYVETFYQTLSIYREHGMRNIFVTPFSIPIGGLSFPVLRALNRLGQAFP